MSRKESISENGFGPHYQEINSNTNEARSDADAPVVEFLNLKFQNVSLAEAAYRIVSDAVHGVRSLVFFVNAHCVNVAARDDFYSNVLRNGQLLFADGVGMAIAARLWGVPLKDNVNGTDLFPVLCQAAAVNGVKIALLGARPGIAEECASRMTGMYPELRIVWTHHGYYPKDKEERILSELNQSGAQIIFVAKGVPMQELWISEHASMITAPVMVGVGALFDFYSGAVRRAPRILRKLRLEWLYRLLIEPKRLFFRYIVGNPLFLMRIIFLRIIDKISIKHPQ